MESSDIGELLEKTTEKDSIEVMLRYGLTDPIIGRIVAKRPASFKLCEKDESLQLIPHNMIKTLKVNNVVLYSYQEKEAIYNGLD